MVFEVDRHYETALAIKKVCSSWDALATANPNWGAALRARYSKQKRDPSDHIFNQTKPTNHAPAT